jgi:uncharacterized protein YcbK (DUF882 family)
MRENQGKDHQGRGEAAFWCAIILLTLNLCLRVMLFLNLQNQILLPGYGESVFYLLRSIVMFMTCFTVSASLYAGTESGHFFLMGDGRIHIRNTHTGAEAEVTLLAPDGSLNKEGFTRIDRVFGFPTEEKGENISPRLIFMLDYFSDLVAPGKVINLESGYRSPEYNSRLRDAGGNVGGTSTHIDGMAIDFFIEGVNGKELWEIIRSSDCCGAGYYGGKNVHLDSARPRFWEAATSKVRTGESDYNRRIYISTDYDRYKAGDKVRLSFSSVSDFGFGIKPVGLFVNNAEGDSAVAVSEITPHDTSGCLTLPERKSSRFLYLTIPPDLHEGRYRIRIDFCRRPFDQMPLTTVSHEIEILGRE